MTIQKVKSKGDNRELEPEALAHIESQTILKDFVYQEEGKGAHCLLRVVSTGSELLLATTEMRQFVGISKPFQGIAF